MENVRCGHAPSEVCYLGNFLVAVAQPTARGRVDRVTSPQHLRLYQTYRGISTDQPFILHTEEPFNTRHLMKKAKLIIMKYHYTE